MRFSLFALSCVLAAVVVTLPADTEALFSGLHSRLDAMIREDRARTAAGGGAARSALGSNPGSGLTGGGLDIRPMARGRGGKGKVIRRIMDRVKEYLKKKAMEERKKPEIDEPNLPNRDRDRDDRKPIETRGPYGRESRRPGSTGGQIEGAFHGDTNNREVKQIGGRRESGSDRRDRIHGRDRTHGRTERRRGSSGRSIEN